MHLSITKKEAVLLLDLLDRAGEDMGNAGCNDYDINIRAMFTPEERTAFIEKMRAVLSDDDIRDSSCQMDFLVLAYFTKLIRSSAALHD